MWAMGSLSYDQQIVIRSLGKVKETYDGMISGLRAAGRLRFRGKKLTKEAFGNAVMLYFGDMSREQLEGALAPYVAELEKMLDGEDSATPRDVVNGETVLPTDQTPPRGRRKA